MTDPGEREALILVYHRVAEVTSDPWGLAVSPRHFAEHLEVLQEQRHPVKLGALRERLRAGDSLSRAVVVTFDDGYADNLTEARPILERWRVPATVFVVTGHLDTARPFWWDVLEAVFLRPGVVPATLRLTIDGQSREWNLSTATALDERQCETHRTWRAWTDPPTARHETYLSLWRQLRPLLDHEQQQVIEALVKWAGLDTGDRSAWPRRLSIANVGELRTGGLIDIGAHTVTHPFLPALAPADQDREIRRSRETVGRLVGQAAVSFAYPYGGYVEETVEIVRQVGFSVACTAQPGRIDKTTDGLRLPRVAVPDCPGDVFARHLAEWAASS